ncbi:MAG: FG-GAP-like repeat-containing protein, partial [Bacteroidia bacterium]|nr:FG-GAP-like repeat-containing protein [Bacteroidia bacterium]
VGDIDGDGDMDVVATAWNNDKVVWFENTDSLGTFSGEILIGEPNAPADCALADIDGDGDLDIVSNSKNDDDLFWYENTDGMGTFSAEKFIDEGGLDKAYSIAVGDVNGDGYLDVICSAEGDDIHLYNNTDGLGSFSTATKIDSAANDCREIVLSDIDGDGDLDLMMGSNDGDFHGYYINDAGTFGARVDFNTQDEEAYCIVAADFDKDGDNDIITGHTSSTSGGLVNNIRLWENVCGLMITGQPIAPTDSMEGSTFKFGVGTSVSSVSFQWEKDGIALVDSGSVSGSATDTLTITNAMAADEGEYMARVTIDQTGCLTEVTSDTVEIALIISSNEAPYEVSFKLGPNPAKTYVKVVDLAENGLIKLIDINGKVILNQVHNANQLNHKLDVSNLPRGYYYLNFEGSKGTYTQKLHIQ